MSPSKLANLPSPLPIGNMQFFDGYFPALAAGTYTISLQHTITGNSGAPAPFSLQQSVTVQAPEFTIDTSLVQRVYPPRGSAGIYDKNLPFLILADPALPWERSLIPGDGQPNPASPTAWMALLVFAENEMRFPPNSNNPVTTSTVGDLLAADQNQKIMKPQLPTDWVTLAVLKSQCQTITIPGAVFNAVAPTKTDLPYLTHCRGVNTLEEGELLLSIFLANRMPQGTSNPPQGVRYFAHLVSLEGFGDYMGPDPKPIPTQPQSQDLMDVQMVSLFNWSFTSLPETGESFYSLLNGLVESQQATATQQSTVALQLPLPPSVQAPQNVQDRLNQGFVPLQFISGSGEESFAWYRGPFTAQAPQPLPEVGAAQTPVRQANTADELMIYLAEQGLFDLSYAAAWNLGRQLALADGVFSRQVAAYRNQVSKSFALIAQRTSMQYFAVGVSSEELLATAASRSRFTHLMAEGLGSTWTTALRAVWSGTPPPSSSARKRRRFAARASMHPRVLVSSSEAVAAVSSEVTEFTESIAAWLAKLSLLHPIPFSYLVPDPRMLPVESIRFFYLDAGWTDALIAGALSIAIHGSAEVQQQMALMPSLRASVERHRVQSYRRTRSDAAVNVAGSDTHTVHGDASSSNGVAFTGILIRSALVSGWPNTVITATVGGAPLNLVRDDCPSSSVRLVLFDGIPDTVTLAEPYHGLLFGVEDKGVYPRCVSAPAFTGSQIANAPPVTPTFRPAPDGMLGGVLDVESLASALETSVGIEPFDASAQVNWNKTPISTVFVSGNQLQATITADLVAQSGPAQITVTSKGATSQPQTFLVDAALSIDSINPTLMLAGADGFILSIDGAGFGSGATVYWGTTALTTTPISANQIMAQVPADLVATTGSAAITVVVENVASNAATLRVVSADPILDSVVPDIATVGDSGFSLTVNGVNFAAGAIVQWSGSNLTTTFLNDRQLKAAVPKTLLSSANSVQVSVSLNSATSNAVPFTIANAVPTIGSLRPSVALAGDGEFTLVLDGVNFGEDSTVNWGNTRLTPATISPDLLTVDIPADLVTSAGSIPVTVQTSSQTSNQLDFLVIGPQPAIGLLDPPMVIAGSQQFILNIYGGFGAGDFALQMVALPEMQTFPTT